MPLTADHEVLTHSDTWVPLPQLTREHQIATLNFAHEIEYVNPSRIYTFPSEDGVYTCETRFVSLRCSPSHRLLIVGPRGAYTYACVKDFAVTELDVAVPTSLSFNAVLRPADFVHEPYTGILFAVSIPNSNLFVRRNGKIHFTG